MKFGQNPMQFFDKRFAHCSYFWWGPKEITLSFIMVEPKYRGQGVLSKLLREAKRYGKRVVIPIPCTTVKRVARRHGYTMTTMRAHHKRFTEEIEAMEWKPPMKRKIHATARTATGGG